MTRDIIDVQYPVLNHEECIANISIEKHKVDTEKGVTIKDVFSEFYKKEHVCIIIDNLGEKSMLTVIAGDVYPNSMLGDIGIELPEGTSAIPIQDLSRFIKRDGSIDLDFAEDFKGNVCAIASFKGASNE